ncbi:2,3,4,5-tetrahydropyridine-2,6-dicarboxylate N-acetyltransferase [Acetilactobacillus jinshanensis]|uniref:2,3,4,5-tetrahydropyridine-2,6-dicarboxylate N-acetyltransferase n=1 Tax=Acetilactobacillus jinshanensis TaxID=1720083 RepID=A0A4P6ZKS2_9LACO|nr:2,3,4,5-tetrahydropyridine-2,6-dicarboxylate N-acetyltransferase [Acetilactobacillus jinshanensis]QBP18163.1 2,3,4,5-tetrahydropyridine-2,6-dicarboxylate N-acetyltransferase [Acetilactobacillus jinshanensis]URL61030.1 2,3,4,5-tetrahydropyridine-2,6-dicarboxylate N-acetyltransferase [uncultured bacterium]
MPKLNAKKIISFISNSKKETPVKVYVKGDMLKVKVSSSVKTFDNPTTGVWFGDWVDVKKALNDNANCIDDYVMENSCRNSAVPLLDLTKQDARIEPGSFIRDHVSIGHHVVVMMGAVINIGAEIGDNSMIDMNAVLGGRAIIGKDSHIGAGAVIAGVVEPASAKPVRIDDHVLVGANAVVVEGVHVGEGAVIGAGAVVLHDVPAHTVVAGVPAKVIKKVDTKTKSETGEQKSLRKM